MITALDVAKAAGVSKTTVSYVFSQDKASLISEKTRQKVLCIAAKLGYQPSYLGRSLSANRTFNVALVLPSRCGYSMSGHLLEIFHGIIQGSDKSEYNLSIFLGGGERLNSSLRSRRIDGVIALGIGSDNTLLEHIASFKLPMVVVNKYFPADKLIGCVRLDIATWLRQEVDAMQQKNCRNILILNKSTTYDAGREIAMAAETLQKDGSKVRVDITTLSEDPVQQLKSIIAASCSYDGFIINGSENVLSSELVQKFTQAQRPYQLSYFYSTESVLYGNRVWHRNGYVMGENGWKMLQEMLNNQAAGREILLPVVTLQQGIRQEPEPDSGIDL